MRGYGQDNPAGKEQPCHGQNRVRRVVLGYKQPLSGWMKHDGEQQRECPPSPSCVVRRGRDLPAIDGVLAFGLLWR